MNYNIHVPDTKCVSIIKKFCSKFSHEGKSLTTPDCHLNSLKSHQNKGNDKKNWKLKQGNLVLFFLLSPINLFIYYLTTESSLFQNSRNFSLLKKWVTSTHSVLFVLTVCTFSCLLFSCPGIKISEKIKQVNIK